MASYSDDFNRANGGLGSNWTVYTDRIWIGVDTDSNFAIASNEASVVNAGEAPLAEYTGGTMDTDFHSVSVTIGSSAPQIIALILQSDGIDYVYGYFNTSGSWGIYSAEANSSAYANSSETVRATRASQSFTVGDVLTFEVSGSTYRIRKNGAVIFIWTDGTGIVSWNDSSHRNVAMMVYANNSGDSVDNFAAADIDDTVPYVVACSFGAAGTQSPTATFSAYTPQEGDIVVLWSVSGSTSRTLSLPSGWENPLGGNTDVESDAHQMSCVYHVVTAAEETAVTQTYTATNLYTAAVGLNYHGVVVRNSSGIEAVNSALDSTDTVTPHVLAGLSGGSLGDNSLVLSSVGKDGTGLYNVDGPSGWSYLISEQAASLGHATLERDTLTTSGNDVNATNITPSAGDEYISITLAFAAIPPAASSSPNLFFHWLMD